jgi:hypothetical protein
MFKLIGIIVFGAVIFIGYPALNRWYAGEASPKETVNELRNSVGQSLMTNGQEKATPPAEKSVMPVAPPSYETEAEKALRKLLEKK